MIVGVLEEKPAERPGLHPPQDFGVAGGIVDAGDRFDKGGPGTMERAKVTSLSVFLMDDRCRIISFFRQERSEHPLPREAGRK